MDAPVFGKEIQLRHFFLDPKHAFVNHGSYGAAPRPVLDARLQYAVGVSLCVKKTLFCLCLDKAFWVLFHFRHLRCVICRAQFTPFIILLSAGHFHLHNVIWHD